MITWIVLLALSLSLLPGCTLSSLHTYEVAKLTLSYDERIKSFFGANAVPGLPLNVTDYQLKIDVENLKARECMDRDMGCVSGSPSFPAAYRVVCEGGLSAQTVVDRCSGSGQLELLILCVTESRARELLTGERLRVVPQRLRVILVNRTDDRPCPLFKRVRVVEITANTNISVTVRYSGMSQLNTSNEMHPDSTQSRSAYTSLTLFALFSIILISAVLGIWLVAGCLRSYLKKCRRPQEVCVN